MTTVDTCISRTVDKPQRNNRGECQRVIKGTLALKLCHIFGKLAEAERVKTQNEPEQLVSEWNIEEHLLAVFAQDSLGIVML